MRAVGVVWWFVRLGQVDTHGQVFRGVAACVVSWVYRTEETFTLQKLKLAVIQHDSMSICRVDSLWSWSWSCPRMRRGMVCACCLTMMPYDAGCNGGGVNAT